MSTNCSFEQHIIELCKRCTGLCGWILRTFSSRESTVMMTLFKSLVLSRLDYGSQLWSPTKIHQIIMIEKIQKAFTKHIKGFSSFSYQERLSNLQIYSLQRRRERYIIIYVWKILENLVPNLVKPLQFYVSMPTKPKCPKLSPISEDDSSLVFPFTEEEYKKGIAALKNKKAAGIDDVLVEQLKNLGPRAHRWIHSMLNVCFTENRIPKVWRQSKIIAILKPGKDLYPSCVTCINCTNVSS